jgi:hypothetical protein
VVPDDRTVIAASDGLFLRKNETGTLRLPWRTLFRDLLKEQASAHKVVNSGLAHLTLNGDLLRRRDCRVLEIIAFFDRYSKTISSV